MRKPREVFDRIAEWTSLAEFAGSDSAQTRFGLVYGRRRQGKSWLIERLTMQAKGWYWEAQQGTARQQLDAFAQQFQVWNELPAIPHFADWHAALEASWTARPPLLTIDEFQYLVASSPELPSLVQRRVSRRSDTRLLVCGSALGPMRQLIGPDAPLRGRASLELVVRPFDFRTAARYWQLERDWESAARLHALVGGTPAYLDFTGGRSPSTMSHFDDWVTDVLLNPTGALFREGRILADEPAVIDRSLYFGVLTAIAGGNTRRGQIAATLGRPENTLSHPLNTLIDLAMIDRVDDPLHQRRSTFHLTEPLLRTYASIIGPNERVIERRGSRSVWHSIRGTVESQIYGPHFESLARDWALAHASKETLGGLVTTVGPSVANSPTAKRELEIDVVATAGREVLAIGEAKWTKQIVGVNVLRTLELRRSLLGHGRANAKLLLFSSAGFSPEVEQEGKRRHDLELIDLERLYTGD